MTHPRTTRPHLELLQGGRCDPPDDWQAFCRRIGWQELGEPPLPADYEERLASRIFGSGNTVTFERAHARPLRWLAAMAIAAGIMAAVYAWCRADAPTADVVPTPVPEVAPPPPAPPLVRPPERPKASPDRGMRHARSARRAPLQPAAAPIEPAPAEVVAISPDPEPGTTPRWRMPLMPMPALAEPPAQTAGRSGRVQRDHLAMALPEAAGARAVAVVDVLEAARQLRERL